jgi:[acyl-carrier-protein] S-malonyltransferase
MSAVLGLEPEVIEKVLENLPNVWLANDNCVGQAVVAAELEVLAAAEPVLQAAGAKRVLRLPVGGAFHTPLQTGAAEAVANWLVAHTVQDLKLPCWMNYTAQYHVNTLEIQENLVAQITHRVRWREAMQNAAEAGVTQAVELGCGKVLSGLAGRCGVGLEGRLQAQPLSSLDEVLRWLEAHC